MTLNILGIAVEEADNQQPECKANPIDQFWLAASDVLIEIVQRQPQIQPIIDAAIDAGGDIEITAHNQGGKISFATGASFGSGETTLMPVDPSECRQHALDCVRLAQTANSPEARKIGPTLLERG